jgi:uncharacterized LabA/DUF88 family protein
VARPENEIFGKLGTDALARVLSDVLDHTRLARLATACGLSYPGMRTRSQKRERLLTDLVERAGKQNAARTAILRTLRKETAAATRAWSRLDAAEREKRVGDDDFLMADGNLGLHLFVLASAKGSPADDDLLERLSARKDLRPSTSGSAPADDAAVDRARKEVARLKKSTAELRKKIKHVESTLAKSRETEKNLRKDLIRRKGELAESRMLAERLRRELDESRGTPRAQARAKAEADFDTLAKSIKTLSSEQRKLAHALGKKLAEPAPVPGLAPEALEPLVRALDDLRKETTALRKDRKRESAENTRRHEEIRTDLRSVRAAAEATSGTGRKRTKAKGSAVRVGVFVDVQNMYYAARQLKGKLDFDALLTAAVRDRRLIQATAYVVESKEIDQSGFFARLQQKAISVKKKTLKIRADGSMKGDWDMEMALDMLDAAPSLDVLALVSGDGDFTSLVKRVKSMGPRVEVLGFPRNTAKSLLEAADRFQPLDRHFMIREPATKRKTSKKKNSENPRGNPNAKDRETARAV